jgi:CheY-like chemotaxis protein
MSGYRTTDGGLLTYDESSTVNRKKGTFVYSRVILRPPDGHNAMNQNSSLVLCIDDEQIGLEVRKILLERAGYRVLTAPDGPTGLAIFSAEPIEAVILDYSMPGMHGGEVAAQMRQAKPRIPILLLSAYIGLSPEVTALVDLYMTKGEGAPILLEKLGSLLQPVGSSWE